MPVPTPTMPGAGYEENIYRGQAMAQLRILKQQMQLGGLWIGSRKVSLGNGVTCFCNICFNLEEVFISIPSATDEVTGGFIVAIYANDITYDSYTGFSQLKALNGYSYLLDTLNVIGPEAEPPDNTVFQAGNMYWKGTSGLLSYFGPYSRYGGAFECYKRNIYEDGDFLDQHHSLVLGCSLANVTVLGVTIKYIIVAYPWITWDEVHQENVFSYILSYKKYGTEDSWTDILRETSGSLYSESGRSGRVEAMQPVFFSPDGFKCVSVVSGTEIHCEIRSDLASFTSTKTLTRTVDTGDSALPTTQAIDYRYDGKLVRRVQKLTKATPSEYILSSEVVIEGTPDISVIGSELNFSRISVSDDFMQSLDWFNIYDPTGTTLGTWWRETGGSIMYEDLRNGIRACYKVNQLRNPSAGQFEDSEKWCTADEVLSTNTDQTPPDKIFTVIKPWSGNNGNPFGNRFYVSPDMGGTVIGSFEYNLYWKGLSACKHYDSTLGYILSLIIDLDDGCVNLANNVMLDAVPLTGLTNMQMKFISIIDNNIN